MFTDPSGMIKKFIVENEGNAWYIDESTLFDTGHASLYFIQGGEEYLISFYPNGHEGNFKSSNENSIWTKSAQGTNITKAKDIGKSIMNSEIDSGLIFIDNSYIDTGKILEYYHDNYENGTLPGYNTFTNNCSDEVEKALSAGKFFTYTRFYGISTPVIGNVDLPGTTPRGLSYDITLELAYKKIISR